jgi:hypothetical protein
MKVSKYILSNELTRVEHFLIYTYTSIIPKLSKGIVTSSEYHGIGGNDSCVKFKGGFLMSFIRRRNKCEDPKEIKKST